MLNTQVQSYTNTDLRVYGELGGQIVTYAAMEENKR